MSGAVVLLVGSLINAITDASWITDWVPNASFIIGYGLLAWGFFLAMRARSETKSATISTVERTEKAEPDA